MKKIDLDKLGRLVLRRADEELSQGRICGKEITVLQDGEMVFHGVFGSASVGGPALRGNMIYRIASMTKPVTAAAVLMLADGGKIDLYAPLSDYYPEASSLMVAEVKDGRIVSLRAAENPIRVIDLLSHTSGIGCSPVLETLTESDARLPLGEAVKKILALPLSFEPRTWQAYSPSAAFDVAAGIVAIASDMPYAEFLKKKIFDPLGMADTGFALSPEQWRRTVAIYDRDADGRGFDSATVEGCVFEDFLPERSSAGAGLASTASDFSVFAETLRLGGVSPSGVRILSEEAVRLMRTPNVPESIPMGYERWGLGVRVIVDSRYPHGLCPGCFGWSGAYGTHFWVDPENRITAVMMKNSRYDGGAGNMSACGLERDVYDSAEV